MRLSSFVSALFVGDPLVDCDSPFSPVEVLVDWLPLQPIPTTTKDNNTTLQATRRILESLCTKLAINHRLRVTAHLNSAIASASVC